MSNNESAISIATLTILPTWFLFCFDTSLFSNILLCSLKEIHPNYSDARTAIQAYYLLNDIALGTIVGDDEIGKEHNELMMTLENLSRGTGLKINIEAIKDVIAKLDGAKGKESAIEKSRAVFRQQLNNLIAG